MIAGVYPVRDVPAEAVGLLPGSLRGDVSTAIIQASVAALQETDLIVGGLTLALDPVVATGFQLTQAGERVGEPRGGLSDDWYRQIIMGRTAAMSGGGTLTGIVATWRALAGNPPDGRWAVKRLNSPGLPTVSCVAFVETLPDANWLSRASAVLRDSAAAGVEIFGILHLFDAFALAPGGGYGFGSGRLSALVQ